MMYQNSEDVEELLRNRGRTYFWIIADFQGRKVVIGPKDSSEEANEWSYTHLECPFTIYELPTRDKGKATGMLKGKLLDKSGDLGSALQRMRHQIPTMRARPGPSEEAW